MNEDEAGEIAPPSTRSIWGRLSLLALATVVGLSGLVMSWKQVQSHAREVNTTSAQSGAVYFSMVAVSDQYVADGTKPDVPKIVQRGGSFQYGSQTPVLIGSPEGNVITLTLLFAPDRMSMCGTASVAGYPDYVAYRTMDDPVLHEPADGKCPAEFYSS